MAEDSANDVPDFLRDDREQVGHDRTPRTLETREAEAPWDEWNPEAILPSPDPRPGLEHRWIRTTQLGVADNVNVSKAFREGWEPCPRKEYPELIIRSDQGSLFPDNIEIGGQLLCRIPEERMRARNRYFEEKANQQMQSVDNSLFSQNDPRMPLLDPERKTRTTFGRD